MLETREGEFVDGLSLVCEAWELRITRRCLNEDLGASAEATFEDLASQPIVRALVRERRDKARGSSKVEPIKHPVDVWVLRHQHRHRGGTWFDSKNGVIWLLAYKKHSSGDLDDFFPWCKELDETDVLLPSEEDYEMLSGLGISEWSPEL